jgi:hypothetical protein
LEFGVAVWLSKVLFCDEEDLSCVLLHMLVGVFTVFLFQFCSVWLGLLFGYGFITYEKAEWREVHDVASPAIQGLLWGIGIAAVVVRVILWSLGG